MVVSVSTNNYTLKLFPFLIIFILLLLTLLPCQARLMLECENSKELDGCRPKLSLSNNGNMGTSSLLCQDDIGVCETKCESSGCLFTCVDDVGFYCLCHCEGSNKLDSYPSFFSAAIK
ncbi:hypothetical protein BVRB_6g140240 [Beta vulgaris subsp. vulgaris]|uniref:Defensin-like protein n=1 Tax=Beta vulgaris subsp. vulgaris TaxID=3555 RepID=A0A0J8C892_BETVV|nr:hypothetical protein BVRB_6g140240 [Beta vulgaris subsp. vulgaris]